MGEIPNAGTGEAGKGDAALSPAAPVGESAETPEQRIARLQALADAAEAKASEAQKKYEDEHQLRLSHLSKVEEANQIIRQGGTPPTTDPLEAEIADLEAQRAQVLGTGQRDPLLDSVLRDRYAKRDERKKQEQWQTATARAAEVIRSAPAKYQKRAWDLWNTGLYFTGEAALMAAKGESVDELEKTLADRTKQSEEREKELIARQNNAPGSPRGAGASSGSSNRMKVSDYTRKLDGLQKAGDVAGAKQLVRDAETGKLEVVADHLF
jgi:hypothetical protein